MRKSNKKKKQTPESCKENKKREKKKCTKKFQERMKKKMKRNGVLKSKVFEGILIVRLNMEGQHRNQPRGQWKTYQFSDANEM